MLQSEVIATADPQTLELWFNAAAQFFAAGFGALGGAAAAYWLARYDDRRQQKGRAAMLAAEVTRIRAEIESFINGLDRRGVQTPRWDVPLLADWAFDLATQLATGIPELPAQVIYLKGVLARTSALLSQAYEEDSHVRKTGGSREHYDALVVVVRDWAEGALRSSRLLVELINERAKLPPMKRPRGLKAGEAPDGT